MGIKFYCPNGHKLNVKSFLAGKRGICPHCGTKVDIPGDDGDRSDAGGGLSVAPVESAPESRVAPAPDALADGAATVAPLQPTAAQPSVEAARHVPTVTPVHPAAVQPSAAPVAPATATPAHVAPVGTGFPTAAPYAAAPSAVASAPVGSAVAASDPISQAPGAVWYVRPPSGGQYGPASGEIMRAWISEGRVSSDTMVWREGWPDWKLAGPLFPGWLSATPATGEALAGPGSAATSFGGPVTNSSTRPRYPGRRRQPTELTIGLIVMLIIAAFVLFGALIYVINL